MCGWHSLGFSFPAFHSCLQRHTAPTCVQPVGAGGIRSFCANHTHSQVQMPVRHKAGVRGDERGAHPPSRQRMGDPWDHSVKQPHPKMAFSSSLEDKGQCKSTSLTGPGPWAREGIKRAACLCEQYTVSGSGDTHLMM